jgi:preprotein translocase subunit SecG
MQGVISKDQGTATAGIVGGDERRARGKAFWNESAEDIMQDVLWVVATVAFFAVSIVYVHFCDRLK